MFTPVHLLRADSDWYKYRERWQDARGHQIWKQIIDLIKAGAGEHFLEREYDSGKFDILEGVQDLRGFQFLGLNIDFPDGDTFKGIALSYSNFIGSTLTNAVFMNCGMEFADFTKSALKRCTFLHNGAYGAIFRDTKFIDCDFLGSLFTNCTFLNCTFTNVFTDNILFTDCKFDNATSITLASNPQLGGQGFKREDAILSDLYKEISNAYGAGGAAEKERKFRFVSFKYGTRHNTHGREKISSFAWEYLTGYGLRPMRVILFLICWFLFTLICFSQQLNFSDALLLTSGALFTFGAKAELLNDMKFIYHLLYVVTSFFGISMVALFITVIANVFFSRR